MHSVAGGRSLKALKGVEISEPGRRSSMGEIRQQNISSALKGSQRRLASTAAGSSLGVIDAKRLTQMFFGGTDVTSRKGGEAPLMVSEATECMSNAVFSIPKLTEKGSPNGPNNLTKKL